jgi:hypothetical protein
MRSWCVPTKRRLRKLLHLPFGVEGHTVQYSYVFSFIRLLKDFAAICPNSCISPLTGVTLPPGLTAPNGTCTPTDPTPTCNCTGTGFTGSACSVPICTPGCTTNACLYPYSCDCTSKPSYTGPTCNTPICVAGCTSTCTVPNTCDCPPGYGGTTCNVSCINGTVSGNTCTCTAGFTGPDCSTPCGGNCSVPCPGTISCSGHVSFFFSCKRLLTGSGCLQQRYMHLLG